MKRATRAAARTALATASVLFLFAAAPAAGQKPGSSPEPTVIFAVEEAPGLLSHWMEPIATLEAGDFQPVPVSCDEQSAAPASAFFARYLAKGRAYPLLYGSQQVGMAVSNGQRDPGGTPGALADLRLQGGAQVPAAAIATDSTSLARPQSRRREPTPAERLQAAEMAKQIFREHKVAEADLSRLRSDGVAVADLEGRGEVTLIATFVVPTPDDTGIQDSLFFAIKPGGGGEPLVWYDHPDSVAAGEELLYVDQLPLRPGQPDDMLVHVAFHENRSYRIYRFHVIGWRPVFETPVYGCL